MNNNELFAMNQSCLLWQSIALAYMKKYGNELALEYLKKQDSQVDRLNRETMTEQGMNYGKT